jgi:glycerophosphoryl diester phosphodiesterase
VKIWDEGNPNNKLDELVALIHKYDCEKHCYFMTSNDDMLTLCRSKYPKIGICVGYADRPLDIVDRAIEIGADKVQLFKGRCPDDLIKKAHDNGIIVNYFWADNPDEAMKLYDKGVDCVLTNNYLAVKNAFDKRAKNI